MADNANLDTATAKIDAAAEKAYAEAAAKKADVQPVAEAAAPKVAEVSVKEVAAKPVVAKKVAAPKAAPKKPAPKKTAVKKVAAKKVAVKKVVAKTPAPKKASPVKTAKPTTPAIQLKDKIMATAKNTDFVKTAKEAAADVQARIKSAYAKTGELATEATEFTKGNVEALVESGKIFFAAAQELAREDVETGKTALETVTADVKKLAGVKTPTEFMQLQGELARRNFDAAVSFGSKRSEALVKLYNDAFAPLSSRVSLAVEKVRKAA